MDEREDLKSIVAYLPLVLRSSSLFWPSRVVEALKALSEGPLESRVQSGEVLSVAICDLRASLSLSDHPLPPPALGGYALFFDELMSRAEAAKWFEEVVPAMANMLLKLPCLLETHYRSADHLLPGAKTGLRLLPSQQLGIVFLSQELIGALLACAFFCLFPVSNRGANYLPTINFDQLFASLHENYTEKQEHKIKCIVHYFERISSSMPVGFVSFERKVLPLNHLPLSISYPEPVFWSKSLIPLCHFEVHNSGLIEDQPNDALEVDFANKYLGGGALHRGCVQEEIRFMVNPELIAGMLFLPSMADNEAIEIVGAERFSNYIGYASSFRYSGDHVDKKNVDVFGRRKTRIVAIDALSWPGTRQYKLKSLLRETNKAFCGFIDQSKYCQYERVFQDKGLDDGDNISKNDLSFHEASPTAIETIKETSLNKAYRISAEKTSQCLDNKDISIGVVTGNWGCGAFGGDPELKSLVQWLAASQALRPFVSYYRFGLKELQYLHQVTQWILSHKWTVGDLWTMLVEYSSQRLKGDTNLGFFNWLLPSLTAHDEPKSDVLNTL